MSPGGTAMFESYIRDSIQPNGELVPELRLVPFSENPLKRRFYERLRELGWRFNHRTAEWFDLTDPHAPVIPCGRLCFASDYSKAWIQPPARRPEPGRLATHPPTIPVELT